MATEISQVNQYKAKLKEALINPASIQRLATRLLREIHKDKLEIYDPSNPFIQLLEVSATGVSSLMDGYEETTRKLYPFAARSEDDLYLHMSDEDYYGRFALPSSATFSLMMSMDEIEKNLVLDEVTGYSKLVIPRNSKFFAAGIPFSISHPIEIRKLRHGGIQVVWNVEKESPTAIIESNVIEHLVQKNNNVNFLLFSFDASQFDINSAINEFSPSSRLFNRIAFRDKFYLARVYLSTKQTNSNYDDWEEIKTTHTEQNYDPTEVTAILKVNQTEGVLEVSLPLIYVNRFALGGRMRVDIYTTKGELTIDLDALSENEYTYSWHAIDPLDHDKFTKNLSKLETVRVYSSKRISGGREPLTIDELRRRVIMNTTGPRNKPITPDQIETLLEDKHYDIVKNIDVLTNRVFLANRILPTPTNEALITPAGLSIQTLLTNMEDLAGISKTIIDNGNSITITPDTIFQNKDGKLRVVSDAERTGINNLPVDNRAVEITNGFFYYTPWHYILETNETTFDARAYHLSAPSIRNKVFVSENDSTNLSATFYTYKIDKLDNGFKVFVAFEESELTREIADSDFHAQLAFIPQGERDYAYLNGVLEGYDTDDNRIYSFTIETNWHVNVSDGLAITNFRYLTPEPRILYSDLKTSFSVIVSTSSAMPDTWRKNQTDDVVGAFIIDERRVFGISHEELQIEFGQALHNLWTRSRALAGQEQYQTYTTNIPARYREDVYELDSNGSPVLIDSSGNPYFNIIHEKDSIRKDPDTGETIYEFRKGDVVRNENGPVLLNPRKIYQQVDFMLVDGVYYFSNDEVTNDYRSELKDILVSWIVDDLEPIKSQLLEQTNIYFYPKMTTGLIEVMYGAGLTTAINAQQSFNVTLHVTDKTMRDAELLQTLNRKTIEVIRDNLRHSVISMSDITKDLIDAYGYDVMDVRVNGLGGYNVNFPLISILENTSSISLRKRLKAREDGILVIEEDVRMNYIRHRMKDKSDK